MKKLDEFHDDMNNLLKQFSARLEHFLEQDARQRRYAMEADDTTNTKTRERTEGATTVGIALLLAGLNPAQTPARPVSA